MIYINGQKSAFEISQFANFEELIIAANESCTSANEVITEIHLNDELFSELYPHQAEDIETSDIQKVEITTIACNQMASEIVEELFKVTASIRVASTQASESLRRGDDLEGLTLLQDMTEVARNFFNMITYFQADFNVPETAEYKATSEKFNNIIDEINVNMENEDWILVADLLEFEIAPLCAEFDEYLKTLRFHFSTEVNNNIAQ